VRLATWNVNSLKARQDRVEEWLAYALPDVVCLQETKLSDDAFPALAFSALGYDSVHHGHNQWNGVAILSRVGIDAVTTGFDGAVDPYEGDARLIAATCGGVRVVSVYVPNGREVGTEYYERKLEWLAALHDWLAAAASPRDELAILGDFNVAPEDRDVWSVKAFTGSTHVTEPERAAVRRLCEWGMEDAFRRIYPDDERLFTYWDYRAGAFHQHRGMRIDLVLASEPLAGRAVWAVVDRNARKGKQPSDHAPVIVDFADGGNA
jgi:exodeoxyribonuclease-3